MHRNYWLGLLLMLTAGLAFACGGDDSNGDDSGIGESDSPAAQSPANGRADPPSAESTATAAGGASQQPSTAATPAPAAPTPAPSSAVRTVVLDPGHGGEEIGAAANGMVEKHSNLDMAFRVERLLAAEGIRVVLTRRADTRASLILGERPLAGFSATRSDLQARVDTANQERADVFVSIHSNGSGNAAERGIEVWFDPLRPFGDRNRRLATLLHTNVASNLQQRGYAIADRGLKDDSCFRQREDRCFQLFVLGPGRENTREEIVRRGGDPEALGFAPGQNTIMTRATQMPGALVELLFISNAADAAILREEGARDAMAAGIARGVLAFLQETRGG